MTQLSVFGLVLILTFLILTESCLCFQSDYINPSWPFYKNRMEKSTAPGSPFLKQSSSKNYEYFINPRTGQRSKRPLLLGGQNQSGIEREEEPIKKTAGSNNVNAHMNRLKDPSRGKVKGYFTQEYDTDNEFEGYPDSNELAVAVHPPFLQEHLVTAHIRPVWSNQRPRIPIQEQRSRNPAEGEQKAGKTSGPSSIVNIYIVTPQNGMNAPEIQVTNKKYGGFIVPIVNPPAYQTSNTMSTMPPRVSNSGLSSSISSKISDEDRSPARSGSGLLDERKLTKRAYY